jgi:hypothetical protein
MQHPQIISSSKDISPMLIRRCASHYLHKEVNRVGTGHPYSWTLSVNLDQVASTNAGTGRENVPVCVLSKISVTCSEDCSKVTAGQQVREHCFDKGKHVERCWSKKPVGSWEMD